MKTPQILTIAVAAGLAALGSAMGQGTVSPAANDSAFDIVYKSTPRGDLHLDLLYPKTKPSSGKYPLVVYTHGGGWATGTRKKGVIPESLCFWIFEEVHGEARLRESVRLVPSPPVVARL